jgi:hypothetical protein
LIFRTKESININDEEFWINKALELSKKFKIEFFSNPITKKTYLEDFCTDKVIIYSFPLDEFESRITNGIVIQQTPESTKLELSHYIN